ncbi:DUF4145 domain-containing protein [Segetibacter aerophilus]|nr:DUF4145 domain-containing protein [Segetibacter aerophilus]
MSDNLSKLTSCGHCNNISHMRIIGSVNDTEVYEDPDYGPMGEGGTIYSVLECPACKRVNVVSYGWHDGIESDDEINYEILFPQENNFPIGLPDNIASTLRAADKIKTIDVNAYAILLRRLLELVCLDRKANGATLALMLKDLADNNEIPEKLVKVASGLKDFGNIGAHAGIGELSEKEIPIVRALTSAILEYIYSAPHLATLAENKLKAIKMKGKKP